MISKLLKKNEKGFTLMEMLIVVAIIAVLVAIAIPTFNSSLNKAKAATDAANIRAGYATVMMTLLQADTGDTTNKIEAGTAYYLQKDGTVAATSANDYVCKGASGSTEDVAGQKLTWEAGKKITYTYSSTSGKVTIAVVDAT